MTDHTSCHPQVSSPAATGGAGVFFEQHVGASFLSLLLVRGTPPVLTDCYVSELHVQAEHLGWHTDDLLVVGRSGTDAERRLLCQVKRTFRISATDEDCRKAFGDFWADFCNNTLFRRGEDQFAIVTSRGTNRLLGDLCGLLDTARAARDAADFAHRMSIQGVVSEAVRRDCGQIRELLDEANEAKVSDDDFVLFLKHLHLLSYDLNTSTSQTEAWIKTLLAHTASGHDKVGVAKHTWNALLELVAFGMPRAASYAREALPSAILASHTPVGSSDHDALRALCQHGVPVFQNIRTIIGVDCHLPRDDMETRLLTTLAHHRIVVIAGPAGSGKSAIAKSAVQRLADGCLTFAFRAEEFAHPHLDRALLDSQIPLNTVQLTAILAGQGRKVLLIESVERLLEASVRDAFSDLLNLIQGDSSWSVVLTCRDYSLDVVRSSFLQHTGLPHAIVDVPPLSEAEIAVVIAAVPSLARPASNPGLRLLFQNPYILDKASRMTWPETATLPQDERTFRQKFWREVVRDESVAADALPRRRGQVFIDLALRRARTLERYAPCGDLDPQALQGLRRSDLIEFSQHNDTLASPAHDVLEDWAIIEWLEQTVQQPSGSPASLASAVNAYPALRRAYRKWLGEFLECHAAEAGQFVFAVLQDQSLPSYFCDDTVVSALLASTAPRFIQQHEPLLLADDSRLFRRVIHLLRVACKTTPAWLGPYGREAPVFFVPHGTAWAAVLSLIARNLVTLVPREILLLIGLLEDWSQGVLWWSPYPAGADDAARVAFHLLPFLEDYRSEEHRKSVLKVIAKVPNAASTSFLQLVERAKANNRRDHAADELAHLLLDGMDGNAAARDFPDAIVGLAQNRFYLSRDDLSHFRGGFELELDSVFGLRPDLRSNHFPPCAIRGPFFTLLRSHPRVGFSFVVRLFNHCTDWYADPRLHGSQIEPPWETQLRLPDGTIVKQWCNDRLWQLYRGTSVGPYTLQCVLMALERWLLELCDAAPDYLEQWLLKLLANANNVCITSVVASIATAHPRLAGAAGLALLTCSDIVRLDQARLVGEAQCTSSFRGKLPIGRAEDGVYDDERKTTDALPHRKFDLEAMALNLQLTPHRDRVWQILDEHRHALPPVGQQSEDDRIWRLALHRMDIRNYVPAEAQPDLARPDSQPAEPNAESSSAPPAEPRRILFEMHLPDQDLQQMVDEQSPVHQAMDAQVSLFMWGISVFQREKKPSVDPADWRIRLAQARQADSAGALEPQENRIHILGGAPAIVAAVCVRDHWDEITPEERDWCIGMVCQTVEQDCDTNNELIRVSNSTIEASRPSAFVLAAILSHDILAGTCTRVLQALACGLTHSVDQVIAYAAEGVGSFLYASRNPLAETCVGALALRANLLDALLDRERTQPYSTRRDSRQLERDVAPQVRAAIVNGTCNWQQELAALRLDRWYGRHVLPLILAVFGYGPENSSAKSFLVTSAQAVAHWWRPRRAVVGQGMRTDDEDQRPLEIAHECVRRLAPMLLRIPTADAMQVSQPLLQATDLCPRESAHFLLVLILAVGSPDSRSAFWELWQKFADHIAHAPWVSQLAADDSDRAELIDAAFFTLDWEKGLRHWTGLEGYADRVDTFFERLPACKIAFDAYVRFLFQIGEQSLPRAFEVAARRLQQGNAREMLSESNTVYCLQVLLARFVYGNPHQLKSNPRMREAVLYLLDELVESGSSAAYHTRDDFVTPIGPSSTLQS